MTEPIPGGYPMAKTVIRNLILLRAERGWTQHEMARQAAEAGLDITYAKVRRWENSLRTTHKDVGVKVDDVDALAALFDMSICHLVVPHGTNGGCQKEA